jgi:hypothetical protein
MFAATLFCLTNEGQARTADEVVTLMADADLVLLNCQGHVALNVKNYLELRAQWDNQLVQASDPIQRTSMLAGYELYREKNSLGSASRFEQLKYCIKGLIRLKSQLGDRTPFTLE